MAQQKHFQVDSRVLTVLRTLPLGQQKLVEAVIESPEAFTRAIGRPGAARRLRAASQLSYLLQVAPELQLSYIVTYDAIFVVDLLERATYHHFSHRNAGGAQRTG